MKQAASLLLRIFLGIILFLLALVVVYPLITANCARAPQPSYISTLNAVKNLGPVIEEEYQSKPLEYFSTLEPDWQQRFLSDPSRVAEREPYLDRVNSIIAQGEAQGLYIELNPRLVGFKLSEVPSDVPFLIVHNFRAVGNTQLYFRYEGVITLRPVSRSRE